MLNQKQFSEAIDGRRPMGRTSNRASICEIPVICWGKEITLTVEYSATPGTAQTYNNPEEPGEIDIIGVWHDSDPQDEEHNAVHELSAEEIKYITEQATENDDREQQERLEHEEDRMMYRPETGY
jgi:hypothetical protein